MNRDRDVEQWKKANPIILVNCRVLGQMCGRAESEEAARKQIEERGDRFLGVMNGNEAWFDPGEVLL